MATHDYVIANGTGQAVRSDLNDALAAIVSNNSGSSEPATTYAYQWWADTTANVLKIRNSANNAWITLRELDGTLLMEDGSASAPGLSFASDTNTGFFSGGADKIGFATGGAERLEIGSSEVVFNDPSNDVDFRVESNGQTHMLFVDAGNDRVGIATTAPKDALHVSGNIRAAADAGGRFILEDANQGDSSTPFYLFASDSGNLTFTSANRNADGGTTGSSERARIDSSGRLLVGTSSSRGGFFNGSSGFDTLFQIEQPGYATASIVRNSNNTAAPNFILGKTRGTSNGATTVVSSGDVVGEISFQAADGAKLVPAASIEAEVDGTPGSSDMPGRLILATTADGASSPTEHLRIRADGTIWHTFSDSSTSTSAQNPPGLRIYNTDNTSGRLSGLSFAHGGAGTANAGIFHVTTNTATASTTCLGDLAFYMKASGSSTMSEAMRLDSSGRLGLGETSMDGLLVIKGDSNAASMPSIRLKDGTDTREAWISNASGDLVLVNGGNDNVPHCKITMFDGNIISFETANTERMRISDDGQVATHMSSTNGLILGSQGSAGTTYTLIKGKNSSSGINTGNDSFYVYSNGNVQNSNNSYGQISDVKLKENIVGANSQWDDIKAVQVRNFNFKEETNNPTHTQIGVVAQEIEAVSPGLVYEIPDRDDEGVDLGTVTKGVNYSVLYMKAVKALQEAMDRIETLETKVAALEAQ